MTPTQTTLGSWRGIPCHHWDEELPLIASVLEETRPLFTLEVGTMYGGFAAFLADTVAAWGGQVATVDIERYPRVDEVVDARYNLKFVHGDIFSDVLQSQSRFMLGASQPSLLYCDGGAKRRELPLLGHYANVVGVHDYGTEVDPVTCAAWAQNSLMAPYRHAEFEALQAAKGGYFVSRFWRRT